MGRIPLGRGDQLLRLFCTGKRPFLAPFGVFSTKYPWVNEYLLRKYEIYITITPILNLISSLLDREKKGLNPGLNSTRTAENAIFEPILRQKVGYTPI